MKSERNDHISDVKLSRKLYYLRIFGSNAEKLNTCWSSKMWYIRRPSLGLQELENWQMHLITEFK